jgi:hypothetical protein
VNDVDETANTAKRRDIGLEMKSPFVARPKGFAVVRGGCGVLALLIFSFVDSET